MRKTKENNIYNKLINMDFSDEMEYDYESERDCEEYGCDGICRCSTLYVKINEVNIYGVAIHIASCLGIVEFKSVKGNYKDVLMDKINGIMKLYSIDRLIRIANMYEKDSYEVNISKGYYGEELDSITCFCTPVADIMAAVVMPINKLIPFLLEKEYGYLLEDLKDKVWEIKEIPVENIVIGNNDHYIKLDEDTLNSYKNNPLWDDFKIPHCVCVQKKDRIRLIDGYHRLASIKRCGASTVCAIIGSGNDEK